MTTSNTRNADDTESGGSFATPDELASNVIRCHASGSKRSRTAPTANGAEELIAV